MRRCRAALGEFDDAFETVRIGNPPDSALTWSGSKKYAAFLRKFPGMSAIKGLTVNGMVPIIEAQPAPDTPV